MKPQFVTESRLQNESNVEEIHFTPRNPFYMKGKIAIRSSIIKLVIVLFKPNVCCLTFCFLTNVHY
jgi:hypothetical protein